MPMNDREKRLVVVGGVVVVAILVGNFLIPQPSAGAKEKKLLSKAEAEKQTEVQTRAYKRIQEEEGTMEVRVQKSVYTLSSEELVPRVLRDLQTIATKSGIHLREVRPLRPKALTSGQGTKVPLEVRFRAPFQSSVVRFLYDVESPDGKMVVDKMTVTSADAKSKAVEVSAQITVFTRSTAGTASAEGDPNNATN